MNVFAFVLLCSNLPLFWSYVEAYRILGVFPIPAKSHFLIDTSLMEGLAEAGHDVTVIAPFRAENK